MEIFELAVVDDQILKGYEWKVENAKGHVVIMEGMEEHIDRYDAFAKFLNENGYSVSGLDTYGQGLNVLPDYSNLGEWPHEGFAKQVIASDMLIEKIKAEENIPVYLFGHSMGAYMAQDYIERFPGHVKKMVLCGSGAKNNGVKPGIFMAKILINKRNCEQKAKFFNSLMFGGFNARIENPRTSYDWLSYNEDNVNKYVADPLCGFGPRNKFCYEFLRGMSRLYSKNTLGKISKDQEILIISGAEDPVTNYSKSVDVLKKMYNKYGITKVSTKIFDHMRHEILNEKHNDDVLKTVLDFFND